MILNPIKNSKQYQLNQTHVKRFTNKMELALISSELFDIKFIISLLEDRVIQAFFLLACVSEFFFSKRSE